MKKTLEVINAMQAAGVIGSYAIGGAMAAIYYTEPTLTEDLDILLSFDALGESSKAPSGLLTLSPIVSYLASLGYQEWRKEGLVVEGWPVQFLPAADALDDEALAHAETVKFDLGGGEEITRILRADYLIAIALRTGRPKDFIRIAQLIGEQVVDSRLLGEMLQRHGLIDKWQQFCLRHRLDAGSEPV